MITPLKKHKYYNERNKIINDSTLNKISLVDRYKNSKILNYSETRTINELILFKGIYRLKVEFGYIKIINSYFSLDDNYLITNVLSIFGYNTQLHKNEYHIAAVKKYISIIEYEDLNDTLFMVYNFDGLTI